MQQQSHSDFCRHAQRRTTARQSDATFSLPGERKCDENQNDAREARDALRYFKHPHFSNTTNYITVVEVDPAWVKEILPPPLKPAAPIVSIALSEGDQFHGLVMGVQAKYGDTVGDWGLAYVMDTDLAVIFGREGLAEPKKLGVTTTDIADGKFVGTVSRWGE